MAPLMEVYTISLKNHLVLGLLLSTLLLIFSLLLVLQAASFRAHREVRARFDEVARNRLEIPADRAEAARRNPELRAQFEESARRDFALSPLSKEKSRKEMEHESYRWLLFFVCIEALGGIAMLSILPTFFILLKTKVLFREVRKRFPRMKARSVLGMWLLDGLLTLVVFLGTLPLNVACFLVVDRLANRAGWWHTLFNVPLRDVFPATLELTGEVYDDLFSGMFLLGDREWACSSGLYAAVAPWAGVWLFALTGWICGDPPSPERGYYWPRWMGVTVLLLALLWLASLPQLSDPEITQLNHSTRKVARLVRQLKDPSPEVRASAAFHLGLLKTDARPVQNRLIAALKDEALDVRFQAAMALLEMGWRDRQVVAPLVEKLEADPDRYFFILHEFRELGTQATPATEALIKVFKNSRLKAKTRAEALETLGTFGSAAREAVPRNHEREGVAGELIAFLLDDEEDKTIGQSTLKGKASAALRKIGLEHLSSKVIIRLHERDKRLAVGLLCEYAKRSSWTKYEAEWVAELLIQDMSSEKVCILSDYYETLDTIRPYSLSPSLLIPLLHPSSDARHWAARFLGRMGAEARPASHHLIALLKGRNYDDHSSAVLALRRIGLQADSIPHLARLFDERDVEPHEWAVQLLLGLAPHSPSAVEVLATRGLSDKDATVRNNVVCGLGKLTSPSPAVVQVLGKALRDETRWVRWNAARCMDHLNFSPELDLSPILPALIQLLEDENLQTRAYAVSILEKLGGKAEPAIPALMRLKNREEGEIRRCAAFALDRIARSPEAKMRIRALQHRQSGPKESLYQGAPIRLWVEALRDESVEVRKNAAETLGRIGPATHEAVPALVAALRDSDYWVRYEAITALGEIGPPAQAAGPYLLALLGAKEEQLGRVGVALAALGPGSTVSWAAPALAIVTEDRRLSLHVAEALMKMDRTAAPRVLAIFIDALARPDDLLASDLDSVLIDLGPLAAPPLTVLLDSRVPQLRIRAAATLARVAPEQAPQAARVLLRLLQHLDPVVRSDAATQLGFVDLYFARLAYSYQPLNRSPKLSFVVEVDA